jgi:hypothetical protein
MGKKRIPQEILKHGYVWKFEYATGSWYVYRNYIGHVLILTHDEIQKSAIRNEKGMLVGVRRFQR